MKAKEVFTEVGEDGLARAPWVDASINPKKHGLFEGHFKGEPGKVRQFFWSGRRWCFKNFLGKWVVSAFGEKGDRWRGLCDSTDTIIVAVDGSLSFPDNPKIDAPYYSDTGQCWVCTGKHWVSKGNDPAPKLKSVAIPPADDLSIDTYDDISDGISFVQEAYSVEVESRLEESTNYVN